MMNDTTLAEVAAITIHFNRIENTAHYPMPPDVADYTASSAYGWQDIIRQMTDAGTADAPVRLLDERGMACFTIRSLHAGARRYRPTDAERAEKAAHKKAMSQ